MTKQLMTIRQNELDRNLKEVETAITPLQTVLNEAKKVSVLKVNTMDDLMKLITNGDPIATIKQLIAREVKPVEVAGIMQDPMKVVDTLQLPDFTTLLTAIEKAKDIRHYQTRHLELKGGIISFPEKEKEAIREIYCVYATTPAQQKLFEAYKNFVKAANEFNAVQVQTLKFSMFKETQISKYFSISKDFVITERQDFVNEIKRA